MFITRGTGRSKNDANLKRVITAEVKQEKGSSLSLLFVVFEIRDPERPESNRVPNFESVSEDRPEIHFSNKKRSRFFETNRFNPF